jgi:tetratricopeptide (TPR) repeat protein
MQHDPSRRYESASALAGDIERWLADEPVVAYRENVLKRISRRLGFHRRPHFLALTIVLLIADFLLLSVAFCAMVLPAGHFATTAISGAVFLWAIGVLVLAQVGAIGGALIGLVCGYAVRVAGFGSKTTVHKSAKRLAWTGGIVASLLPFLLVLFFVTMAGVSIFTPVDSVPSEDEHAARAYNDLAWIQATGSSEVRDGAEAVRNARKACRLDDDDYEYLNTLAAAYAETGDFQLATETQQKAIDLAASKWELAASEWEEDPELKNLARRLDSYKSRRPWRDGR